MSIDPYSEYGNKLIQGYIREFDKLYFQQKRNDGGQRFVKVEDKELTIEEFLKYKLENIKTNDNNAIGIFELFIPIIFGIFMCNIIKWLPQ